MNVFLLVRYYIIILVSTLGIAHAQSSNYGCQISPDGYLLLTAATVDGSKTVSNWKKISVEPKLRGLALSACSDTLKAFQNSQNDSYTANDGRANCSIDRITRGYIIKLSTSSKSSHNNPIAFDGWGFESPYDAVTAHSTCCNVAAYMNSPATGNINAECSVDFKTAR